MIVSAQKVKRYLDRVPPMQETLRNCYFALGEGNLPLAARHAAADPALLYYLRQLTTRPLYGFPSEIKDPAQIFGILGLGGSRSAVENFLFSRLLPERFSVFEITPARFMAYQDEFLARWLQILRHLKADEMRYAALPPLLMGAIIVTDGIFGEERETVVALRGVEAIDFNTLLERFAGVSLFETVMQIARFWELPEPALALLRALGDRQDEPLARWLHLLLFYMLSKPEMVSAGLNDFLTFDPDYAQPVTEAFFEMVNDAADH